MTSFNQLYADIDNSPEYVAAGVQFDVAMATEDLMDKLNISNTQLAEAVGCSKPYITKILRGDSNFTILSLAKIACALNSDLKITLEHREAKNEIIKRAAKIPSGASLARKFIASAIGAGDLRNDENHPWASEALNQLNIGYADDECLATAS